MSFSDLVLASQEIDANLFKMQTAKAYYTGESEVTYHNEIMDKFFKNEDFEGILNYAAIPVDAVADRLQLLEIKGPTDDVTAKIAELMDANKMQLRFGQFILDVLVYGEYYMAVWPEDNDASEIFDLDSPDESGIDLEGTTDGVPLNHKAKFMFCDAETTRAFYDDGGEQLFVARKWQMKDIEGRDIFRVNLNYPDRIEKFWWYIEDDIKNCQPWFDNDQDEWPMENPYGAIPIFHFSTAFPHGIPEHKAMYGVQDAINKIFQTHISSIEYLGFPIVYALMDPTGAGGTGDFSAEGIDDTDTDSASDVNRLENSPGSIWALRAQSVGQLEPAGSDNFIQSLKNYKEIASEVTGLPARLFTSTDGQHPGADAVNAADAVLRQRVIDRSILLSESLKQMIVFAMKMAFGIELKAKDISVIWKPQKIEMGAAEVQIMQFKMKDLFMPPRMILSEMGYTPAECDQILGFGEDGSRQVEEKRKAELEQFQATGPAAAQKAKIGNTGADAPKADKKPTSDK